MRVQKYVTSKNQLTKQKLALNKKSNNFSRAHKLLSVTRFCAREIFFSNKNKQASNCLDNLIILYYLRSSAAVEFLTNFTVVESSSAFSALIRGLPCCFRLNDLRTLASSLLELETFSIPSLRLCLLCFWRSDSLMNLLIKRKFGYKERTYHGGKFRKFHNSVLTKFPETLFQRKSKLRQKKNCIEKENVIQS